MDSESSSPGMTAIDVLVVDDDHEIREILTEILVDEGYSVMSAGNGAEALRRLTTARPAMILLDLNMPIMNGTQFRDAQRRDAQLSTIPTVVMTAIDRIQDHVEALGVDEAIPKPVALPELLAVVARYVAAP